MRYCTVGVLEAVEAVVPPDERVYSVLLFPWGGGVILRNVYRIYVEMRAANILSVGRMLAPVKTNVRATCVYTRWLVACSRRCSIRGAEAAVDRAKLLDWVAGTGGSCSGKGCCAALRLQAWSRR